MSLLSDAKQFFRDMVEALAVTLERVERRDPAAQLFLASQLIGSCDSLMTLLVFFGESAPGMERFAAKGRRKLAVIRGAARALRSDAYREVCETEEPAPEPDGDGGEAVEAEPPALDANGEVTPIGGANGRQADAG